MEVPPPTMRTAYKQHTTGSLIQMLPRLWSLMYRLRPLLPEACGENSNSDPWKNRLHLTQQVFLPPADDPSLGGHAEKPESRENTCRH